MAPAVYFHTRALQFGKHIALVTAGAGAVFAFYESFSIYGGNVASTLAGEFSYSWSFALSLVYLGLLIKAVRDDRKYAKWAALALALTALCHVLTTLVVVFASFFVLFWKKGLARTLMIWFWGFAIAAFWALPLLVRIGLTSDMAWNPLSRWEEIFPVEVWLLVPIAIPAAIWALRRTTRVVPLLAATILPILYFPLPIDPARSPSGDVRRCPMEAVQRPAPALLVLRSGLLRRPRSGCNRGLALPSAAEPSPYPLAAGAAGRRVRSRRRSRG